MVKTYAVNCNDAWLNTKGDDISGSYVKYEDYAELERRLLAAEAQEPVYQVLDDGSWTDYSKEQLDILLESKPSTLFRVAYAAPQLPQPAVPDVEPYLHGLWPHAADALIRYSEACRAALLKQPSTIQTSDSACSGGEIKQPASKSLQVPDGWIKCSERMPDIGQQVLAANRQINVFEVAIFATGSISGKEYFGTSSGKFLATHWMPLPAAPQPETD